MFITNTIVKCMITIFQRMRGEKFKNILIRLMNYTCSGKIPFEGRL